MTLILCSLIVIISGKTVPRSNDRIVLTGRKIILRLYQLMKDTHEILTKAGVMYWIDRGTLLGAVRHQGIIPWDDDIDIAVFAHDAAAFISLKDAFVALGYDVSLMPFGFKIYVQNGEKRGNAYKFPFLDVFLMYVKDNKVYYYEPLKKGVWATRDGGPIYIALTELLPLVDYKFGSFVVKGPRCPDNFLDSYYKNWRQQVYLVNPHDHKRSGFKYLRLTKKLERPAMPLGPLHDNALVIDKFIGCYVKELPYKLGLE